jgi:HAD superfamily hydrolase (TIGR01509 family)
MISAVIFDMDGVLIDSEPFWKEADIQAYAKVGLALTAEQCAITAGMDVVSSIKYWFSLYPWKNRSIDDVKIDIESHVLKLIQERGAPMAGVEYALDFFEKKNIPIALASSSSLHIIEAVLDKLKLKERFKVYHSAQFELQGKPHPAVFLTTAQKLHVKPGNCLVFEDSINGIKAASEAGMIVVAIPDHYFKSDPRLKLADIVLPSLCDFDENKFDILNQLSLTI